VLGCGYVVGGWECEKEAKLEVGAGKNVVAPGLSTGVVGMKKNWLPEGERGVSPGKCILLEMLGLGRR
jgi:hypothetical protein